MSAEMSFDLVLVCTCLRRQGLQWTCEGHVRVLVQALEKALLTFHTLKMSDINKIVKELWQKTYRNQVPCSANVACCSCTNCWVP